MLALTACGSGVGGHAGEIPTEASARAFLERLVARAQARDLMGYCRVAGGMCDDLAAERGGVAAIPEDPPVVAGTRVIPPRAGGTATVAGGQLLVLCGTDGLGRAYRTEMLVSTAHDGTLYAINGVYWSNSNLATALTTDAPSGAAGIDCPNTSPRSQSRHGPLARGMDR